MSSPVAPHPAATAAMEQRFALDVQGVDSLRRTARRSPDEGLRQVSRQFEALFMGMMLKSMRDATPASGLLDGQHTRMYVSMLDQQLAQHLSGRGMRLADSMYEQLRRSLGSDAAAAGPPAGPGAAAPVRPATPAAAAPREGAVGGDTAAGAGAARSTAIRAGHAAPVALAPLGAYAAGRAAGSSEPPRSATSLPARVQGFVERLGAAARAAARATGIPETLILAQAALESAWGRREVRGDDGAPSFNVFGIKADRSWRGPVTEATTTEVIEGVAHKVRARFRAYGSYEEAFADYAKFLAGNPRYGRVLGEADPARAARELQRAGYATDPAYASKLVRVMKRLF
ncbi:flagellar assembly peptidoglycan hydrolase FlgJ [Ramlibacter sp. RBP-2]|uniref:Peptidoglycan hydrolase FlgJ n=1 Tax=Ramlibacter lithotrophicus TaxID=2606681 RepID=A0A7X6I6F0_9BURK|nr:flagellar assembly peptidoglycan hydrolase FlgJ [Ramlibacter lithotrophicus]NKE66175.1 flagellar assembly peptidoglycan hydrolase FlgJ [Ramlibacter lithotrophicus]